MKNINFKQLLPYLVALIIFLGINVIYFNPAFTGKALYQGDLVNLKGMRQEIVDFREKTGEEPLWTNSMFGGMPAYHISTKHEGNLFTGLPFWISLKLPNPAHLVFLYMLGFFILLIILRVNPWLAIVGAVAFSFSSYLIQIIEAGHSSKAHAIAYMAPLIGATFLLFRKKYLLGGVLFAFFFTLELRANHFQITYYLGLIFAVYLIAKLIETIRNKQFPHFLKSVSIMVIGVVIAVLVNIGNFWSTYEYSKVTMRGESELTLGKEKARSGLKPDYITKWSYGKAETWNLFVPNYKGGSSTEPIGNEDDVLKNVDPQYKSIVANMPQYFGDQPFTSGPAYLGAVVVFLFFLALYFYKGRMKWVVLVSIGFAILLSWGKNLMWFTDLFIDYFPLYNKFRTVTMIQVIVQVLVPMLAFFVLDRILFKQDIDIAANKKKLLTALAIPIGLLLIFYLFPTSVNDYIGQGEYERMAPQFEAANWTEAQINGLWINLEAARIEVFKADVIRTLLLVLASAALIYLFAIKKMSKVAVVAGIGLLVLVDQWSVNLRYLNKDNFVSKRKIEVPFNKTQADQQILSDPDPNYRVLNLAANTFNDASTSYYHKSIGGYHGAKLMRYQEMIDFHIAKRNFKVLNMLNTKYLIVPNQGMAVAQQNPDALGNAWFVNNYKVVENADEEIQALNDFDPVSEAILDKRFAGEVEGLSTSVAHNGSIKLTSYAPNELKYTSNSDKEALAVFSEIYYADGWNAYVDGELMDHFRVNYILRGMKLPAGQHEIVFKFEPVFFKYSNIISMIFSVLLILAVLSLPVIEMRKKRMNTPDE